VLADVVRPAAASVVRPPLTWATEPDEPGAEDVAADTEPRNEQADSIATASSAAVAGPTARRGKIVMAPR
jgi:hypothetical protein